MGKKSPTYVEVCLPYYKQGDDLRQSLDNCGGDPIRGLREDAERLRSAASMLDEIADVISKVNLSQAVASRLSGKGLINIDADTHHIGLSGNPEVLKKLVDKGIASIPDYEEEGEWEERE